MVHKASPFSCLLFVIMLDALSHKFYSRVPMEDLYVDDLVIISDSLEEYIKGILIWKEAKEEKALMVNAG